MSREGAPCLGALPGLATTHCKPLSQPLGKNGLDKKQIKAQYNHSAPRVPSVHVIACGVSDASGAGKRPVSGQVSQPSAPPTGDGRCHVNGFTLELSTYFDDVLSSSVIVMGGCQAGEPAGERAPQSSFRWVFSDPLLATGDHSAPS